MVSGFAICIEYTYGRCTYGTVSRLRAKMGLPDAAARSATFLLADHQSAGLRRERFLRAGSGRVAGLFRADLAAVRRTVGAAFRGTPGMVHAAYWRPRRLRSVCCCCRIIPYPRQTFTTNSDTCWWPIRCDISGWRIRRTRCRNSSKHSSCCSGLPIVRFIPLDKGWFWRSAGRSSGRRGRA